MSEAEGVSSLTKAFFEAGSQSVVGSYWSVPDEVSKIFMNNYYQRLLKGERKDEALRNTKLEMMTNSDLVNPAYQIPSIWSAWSLYGGVEPLYITPFYIRYGLWLLVGLSILLLISLFYAKKLQ
jgi:CHAT domain-containing protein